MIFIIKMKSSHGDINYTDQDLEGSTWYYKSLNLSIGILTSELES